MINLGNGKNAEKVYHRSNKRETETKATNITVLVEVLNSLKPNNFNGDIREIIFQLLNLDTFDWLTAEDYNSAMDLFNYYGGSVNYADCTILQSMQNHGISRIVSFDSDFDRIRGFSRVVWEKL